MGAVKRVLLSVALIAAYFPLSAVPAEAAPVYDMVFPVVGANNYSDTFGDPRSGGRTHEGTDIMSPKLTPVVAVADGTIGWMGSTCCSMAIDHDDGWESWYIHLNNDSPGTDDGQGTGFAPGITSGVRVEQGQLIGWVGDSGNAESSGSHVHFELRQPDGTVINSYGSLVAADVIPVTTFAFAQVGCDFDNNGYHDMVAGVPGPLSMGPTREPR